jgi:hypothetical protein
MIWSRILPLALLLSACCGKVYNFKGANIPVDVKSFSVSMFKNEAPIVNTELGISMTEKLKTKFQQQTSLGLVENEGDYNFTAVIIDYKIEPVNLNANQGTAQNRFTITVQVDFKCEKHPDKNFNKPYTNFRNFDASSQFQSVEKSFANEIADNIVQQIFADVALDW